MKISDLTNIQKRGLEMVIKQTIKQFPFIETIEINDKYYRDSGRGLESVLWLKGGIKFLELSEFSGYPIRDYFYDYYHSHKNDMVSSLGVGFSYGDDRDNRVLTMDTMGSDEKFNYFYRISKKINEELNRYYSYIPDDASIFITTQISDTYKVEHKITLNCSDFYCSD